jgi:predicted helicase
MSLALKPTHATVKAYYDTLDQFGQLHIDHEMAVRSAFQDLLAKSGRKSKPPLTLVPEYRIERARGSSVIVDGALVDLYHLPHGYWEAKDEKDDLAKEVQFKLDKGYPRDNIIFQAPERAILYQGGARILDENISSPESLVQVVNQFFDYKAPHIQEWEQAVGDFSERIPELAAAVKKTIDDERRLNPAFVRSFDDFYALCRQAINPNLSEEAVERMLVQHLLTERIFRKIFANPDFTRRNVVAAEIEKVINELTKRAFNRDEFLGNLDRFYKAIEQSAENATSFSEKQAFLNKVYERFFQGYSPKEADTHGIVYTPQPIVNFMVRSVEEILQKEFGHSLGDKGVHILDPFVGTGNFVVRIMQEIKATDLQYKYQKELHCNEVMLLPYYIASMNIEHAYFDRTGEYQAFPGICLVDTFELSEPEQGTLGFMTAENAERVKTQKQTPIFVIIGNPPYNAGQKEEADDNKNRKYKYVDGRITQTYSHRSNATLLRKLQDPYVKAIRWATDRLQSDGLVAFVTNSSFVHDHSLDGMRACLAEDFDAIYLVDLRGNVHKNPRIAGTTHNVFGIKPGVCISFLIKRSSNRSSSAKIYYTSVDDSWRKEQKFKYLDAKPGIFQSEWEQIRPTARHVWLREAMRDEFETFVPLAGKGGGESLFGDYSLGVSTNRDHYVYGSDKKEVLERAAEFTERYNSEVVRYQLKGRPDDVDHFVKHEDLKWSRNLKRHLRGGDQAEFDSGNLRSSLYRPFSQEWLYLHDIIVDEPSRTSTYFDADKDHLNRMICVTGPGSDKPFVALAAGRIVDAHLVGSGCTTQCFPFYIYAQDGAHRRENITNRGLEQFRSHYHDSSISKWDIFHYIYAVLHHPEYRERYAANLRRELPRIPLTSASSVVKDLEIFGFLVKAGQRLSEIHVHYEQRPEYPLTKREKAGEKLDYRVTKMKLSRDKTSLIYNRFLTLSGIPKETYEYRLGNRSALEWVIDQYQVSSDKRSGITNDPNKPDDPTYILRLIGQMVTVSIETVEIVRSLPSLGPEGH